MRIHFVAICGVGMAPLACMLKTAGHRVTGSDNGAFPPMSDVLAAAGIEILDGFDPSRLVDPETRPDLVVVGNAVPRTNVEAVEAERLGLECTSFPEAVARFFLPGRRSLVVAGTHGKTTTTGMLARALEVAGEDPGYLIGGLVRDLGELARAAVGPYFVIEGDEYDCAYFDKQPKFVHYRPDAAIITSIEFDHADIYEDLDHVKSAFSRLVALVPDSMPIVGCGDYACVREVAAGHAGARLISYGLGDGNDWRVLDVMSAGGATAFDLAYRGRREDRLEMVLGGEMNALNACSVYALCRELGIDPAAVREALRGYRGAARRQEVVGDSRGVTVIDDFAHHPTAVGATLEAMRSRYAGRRIVAVFEPRSNTSRRAIFQDRYAEALTGADLAAISTVYAKANDPLSGDQMLSTERLVASLIAAGVEAWTADGPEDILRRLVTALRPGDVVVCMSNGAFGNLPRRLVDALDGGAGAHLPV